MKSIVFDTGPIISLALNNLLWTLEPMKEKFKGDFFITPAVKRELIDRPLETRKFKFEAIQVQKLIDEKVFRVYDNSRIRNQTDFLLGKANRIFSAYGNYIRLVHYAEMSVVAASLSLGNTAIVLDEKVTRFLIENPRSSFEILKKTLHTSIKINENNLKEFNNSVKNIKTIRSIELMAIAYENGLLDRYLTSLPNARRNLLESILWGLKLNGCATSREEIEQIMSIELK